MHVVPKFCFRSSAITLPNAVAGCLAFLVPPMKDAVAQGVVAYINSPTWYQFASNVHPVGDVDGDGFGDLVITGIISPHGPMTGGTYSGRNGTLLSPWTGSALQDLKLGPLRSIGDLDQDGHQDVAYGSSEAAGTGLVGKAVVFSGLTGQQRLLLTGTQPDAMFGATVDGAGDVDLDGVPDLIVGAPTHNPWGSPQGRATVFSGASGAVLWNFDLFSSGAISGNFARHVAGAGDADNDGFADVAMTSSITGSPPTIRVFSGASAAMIYEVASNVSNSYFSKRRSLGLAGDVNADGFADLIVGDSSFKEAGTNVGVCSVYLGPSGTLGHKITGVNSEPIAAIVGGNVDRAGDWNRDGSDDFLVWWSEKIPSSNPNASAVVRIHSGATGAALAQAIGTILGQSINLSATYVSSDINGDGKEDLVSTGVGVPPYGNGEVAAYAFTTECGTKTVVGAGCSSGTLMPTLGILTDCVARGATLTLTVQASFFTSIAFIVVGSSTAAVPFGGSCVLYPSGALNVVPMPLGIGGAGFVTGQIPKSHGPSDFTLQALVPAPGSAVGLAASSALVFDVP